jgi:hypothetical protein
VEDGTLFRVLTEPRASLVLPERDESYPGDDLAADAPESVEVTADGGYLVKEHLAVLEGATLEVKAGQRLLLASDASGFSSLVTLGGTLQVVGQADQRVQITSWDAQTGAADLTTQDGRAYVRVNEGTATLANADFSNLGFWSGRTGGLALVGGQHPNVEPEQADWSEEGTPTIPLEPSDLPHRVLAELNSVSATGNAYGIYATFAESLSIAGSTVSGSLIDGILLDEGVTSSIVTGTTTSDNAVDGLVSHAGSGLTLEGITASQNGRNGLTLDGTPLAEAPDGGGDDVAAFGGYSVRGGVFTDNARYGVEVVGGVDTTVAGAKISGGDMGIVLAQAPQQVTISDNTVRDAERQGIAIRDQAAAVRASGNRVSGGDVGIYARNSEVFLERNAITDSAQFGITVAGSMRGSKVSDNEISGSGAGATAINAERAFNVSVEGNVVDGWVTSRSLQQVLATIFQPLTILWSAILAVVALAIFWRLGRGPRRIRAEAEHAPLQLMSRGVFDRQSAEDLVS